MGSGRWIDEMKKEREERDGKCVSGVRRAGTNKAATGLDELELEIRKGVSGGKNY